MTAHLSGDLSLAERLYRGVSESEDAVVANTVRVT